jgi:hypothetical protein
MKSIIAVLPLVAFALAQKPVVQTGPPTKKEVAYQAYDGPTRPSDQTAALYFGGRANCGGKSRYCGPNQPLGVMSIDGRSDVNSANWDGSLREGCQVSHARFSRGLIVCDHPINVIQLPPGKHTVHFYDDWCDDRGRGECEFDQEVTVQAGKKYRAELNTRVTLSKTDVNSRGVSTYSHGMMWIEVTEIDK